MELFVGREDEIAEALELLGSIEEGVVLDLVGVRGIGKTALLRHLLERARTVDSVVVRSVDLLSEGIGLGHHLVGDDVSGKALSEVLLQTSRLMLRMTEGFERDFGRVRLMLHQPVALSEVSSPAGNAIQLGERARAGSITTTTVLQLGDEGLRDHIRRAQNRLDDAFVEAWRAFTAHRRVLIGLDSAELIADDEIGAWALRIAPRLPRTLTVITRVPTLKPFGQPSERIQRRHLADLTLDDVRRYLSARLVGERLPVRLPEVVYAFTDGHPYGVVLTAELIDQAGPSGMDPSRLRRALARLPDDGTKWGGLIRALLDEVSDPELTRAVTAAAVVQRFDEPMLAELLAADDGKPALDIGRAMEGLRGYRLTQPVLSVSGRETGWSRLHEFVRQSVDHKTRQDRFREWQRLHSRAADHCFRWLQNWQGGDSTPYASNYRYEDPQWQAYEREWLYHSGFVADRRHLPLVRFTLVFLEAFYWWGCYYPFEFNRELIEDWERAVASWPSDRVAESPDHVTPEQRLADALTFLLDAYPPGGTKPASAPWDEIRATLLLVRDLCGLDGGRRVGADRIAEFIRTSALLNVFLAHTRRYRDPADPAGDRYYRRAQQEFERLDDPWMVAWVQRERADHALERGDCETGAPLWRSAVGGALDMAGSGDEWDYELSADLYRLAADAEWMAGDTVAAACGYGRAVAEAYWYQNLPHVPDAYTQEYYREITGRAVDRVMELAERDGLPAATRFSDQIVAQTPGRRAADPDQLGEALGDRDRDGVLSLLFPAGPGNGELNADDSAFLRDWRLRWEDGDQDPAASWAALLSCGEWPTGRPVRLAR